MLTKNELEAIRGRLVRLPRWIWARGTHERMTDVVSVSGPPTRIRVRVDGRAYESDLEDFVMHAQDDVSKLLETVAALQAERDNLKHRLETVQPPLPGV